MQPISTCIKPISINFGTENSFVRKCASSRKCKHSDEFSTSALIYNQFSAACRHRLIQFHLLNKRSALHIITIELCACASLSPILCIRPLYPKFNTNYQLFSLKLFHFEGEQIFNHAKNFNSPTVTCCITWPTAKLPKILVLLIIESVY